jgi:hypothetical protein
MQVQIDPLVLVLDLEQLLLRSPEELLPLLENHILLIIMGQLRDIKERERLSRGLCREYNKLFAENDILVFPHPLSTKQTDARLLAPRKLAHLVGITTSAMSFKPPHRSVSAFGARDVPLKVKLTYRASAISLGLSWGAAAFGRRRRLKLAASRGLLLNFLISASRPARSTSSMPLDSASSCAPFVKLEFVTTIPR